MYVIDVIPIAKGIGTNLLSYFTAKEVPVGAVVTIPIRKKVTHGIVLSVRKAEEIKSELRSAEFALKKIDQIKSSEFFPVPFMEMINEAADYYATSPGAVMNILVPDYILKNVGKLKKAPDINIKFEHKEKYVVQGDDEERYGSWKGLIRQEFARKKSLIFLMPTIEDTEHAYSLLEKGIKDYIFVLNGSLSSKEIVDTWNKIMTLKHPVTIIATGGFLSIPREDMETIVVERESSRAYKVLKRPHLDIRHVAEILVEKRGMKIFFADNFLRIETLYREGEGELMEASPFKFRSLSTASDLLIDMKKDKTKGEFVVLSPELENLIKKSRDESERMIILGTRRGLSPSTICGDCQNIVVCNNCSSPVVLHESNGKRFFMCHRCGERRSAEEYCKVCGSWKLTTIGIGIDLIREKIKEKFPDINVFKIDSDSTKGNEKTIKGILEKFRNHPGSILIGTELMLQYLHEKVENSAIVSLDSLFALPDFRIQEKILYMLTQIKTLTTKFFIVQTRRAEEKVFEYGLKGNLSDFYRSEIESRKNFKYPPFTNLIKITLEGKKENIINEMKEAQDILDPYEVEVFPAFTHTIRGNYVLHGLIRVPASKTLPKDLISKLRSLSPSITVKVDPETLL
jgi:primosomal protein N' (replication factor Y) (superfamily II helicase)